MMTVNEVSKLTGVSIRTLQYYDAIGLLKPIQYTESGYRLYDDTSLERLGRMYAGGGELTENIDAVCGAGTAEFASKAIDIYYMSRNQNFY